MPSKIIHCGVAIVTLADGETVQEHCAANCIAIRHDDAGWWTCFIDDRGEIDCYDEPYPSRDHATWAAKAAAEFGL